MSEFEQLASLGLALVIGFLLGFEREQAATPEGGKQSSFIGGARTHPLIALLGALGGLLIPVVGSIVLCIAFAGILGFVFISYVDDVRNERDRGLTSEVAMLVTFLLGALSTAPGVIEPLSRRAVVLLAVAVIVAVLLSMKPRLHAVAHRMSRNDVLATLKFLVVAIVVLPLLPNRTYGPLDVLNPFKTGLMVVLIAGIDFVGYALVRVLGPGRGLGLTGLVGGLVSSTAVALSASTRAREQPKLHAACALAVVVASTVMCIRVLIAVAIVHRPLLAELWPPVAAMAAAGLFAAGFFYRRSRHAHSEAKGLELENPFELAAALKWGLLFTLVLFTSKLLTVYLGARGAYLAGLVAGTTDVDAITLSMATLAKAGLAPEVAMTAIIFGAGSNTLVKGAMAVVVGGWSYGRTVLAAFAAMLGAAAIGVAAKWLG